jgi:hypothetical protein
MKTGKLAAILATLALIPAATLAAVNCQTSGNGVTCYGGKYLCPVSNQCYAEPAPSSNPDAVWSCSTCQYTCTGSCVNGLSGCYGAAENPSNKVGVYAGGSCTAQACPSDRTFCTTNSTCRLNSDNNCSEGTVWNPCDNSCATPYVVKQSGALQSVTGDVLLGGMTQLGGTGLTLNAAGQNLLYGNVSGASSAGSLLKLQKGTVDRFVVDLLGNLTLAGQVKITGGSPGAGKVLTSDAAGLATWQVPAAGGVTGSGTANYLSKWSSGTALGNSVIYDDGTNVGVGTASPGAKLEVAGQVKITGGTPGAGKVLTSDAAGLATWQVPAAGGVTSVTASLPLASTGGLTPVISLGTVGLANGGTNNTSYTASQFLWYDSVGGKLAASGYGYSTFAPASHVHAAGDVTSGVFATARLGSGTANNTTFLRGDGTWATPAAGLTGSGTLNYLPKWTPSGAALGNSQIFDDGTNVGIGTPSPNNKLQVAGLIDFDSTLNNTFLGMGAGVANTIGDSNVGVGAYALYSNTSGTQNTATGNGALYYNTTGSYNTAHGTGALGNNTTGRFNTANGAQALFTNSTGWGNVANGVQALTYNTTGSWNVASGYLALQANTTGRDNVAYGTSALSINTTGNYNAAIGSDALFANTSGSYNVANGYYALTNNTTGNYNAANGAYTLYKNTTGYGLVANGWGALFSNTTGNDNVANGYMALYNTTTGNDNVASGYTSLYNNTTGYENVASGLDTLYSNITGYDNVALGPLALYKNTYGYINVASGYRALYANTTGAGNVAIGDVALQNNTTANANTAVGYAALAANTTGVYNDAFGDAALNANTTSNYNASFGSHSLQYATGARNVAMGAYAGTNGVTLVNMSNDTFLGYGANASADGFTNSMALGYTAQVTASNQVVIGNSSITQTNIYGSVYVPAGDVYARGVKLTSDQRLKKDITALDDASGLATIEKLTPVTFHWKDGAWDRNLQYGFIAQDVQKVLPELVGADKDGTLNLNYDGLIAPMVKAMQEQQAEIKDLQKQIEELKAAR